MTTFQAQPLLDEVQVQRADSPPSSPELSRVGDSQSQRRGKIGMAKFFVMGKICN